MDIISWRDCDEEWILEGFFRESHRKGSYYIELEISGLRWNVTPKQAHLKLLGKRVEITGLRVGYKHLRLNAMRLHP